MHIPVQEKKEDATCKFKKHERELEDLQAGVKYNKIYYTKKVKFEDKGETICPGKMLEQKKKKILISKLIPDLLSCPTHLHGILALKKFAEKDT